ncbi:hypothetical protein [Sphingosinicella sp. BN140058]|uniref:hypothetical protein n=1 Tax=Sphingosinicella sp. BN140058 TaxID=1892855 RepID=UPI001012D967|nr:hypothetical protein [Sphingosinicella sp. BN140058]QAY80262.1 hypothetical protein ETR14_26830 [Sphingosinicella sp. BN140058]
MHPYSIVLLAILLLGLFAAARSRAQGSLPAFFAYSFYELGDPARTGFEAHSGILTEAEAALVAQGRTVIREHSYAARDALRLTFTDRGLAMLDELMPHEIAMITDGKHDLRSYDPSDPAPLARVLNKWHAPRASA